MNKRIREVRKSFEMSQQEFAERIKISRSNLGNIETGAVSVTDRVIADICEEFDVDETWLRTGTGKMRIPKSREAEISEFVGAAMKDQKHEIKKQLMHVLSKLSDEQWELLADIAEKLAEEQKNS